MDTSDSSEFKKIMKDVIEMEIEMEEGFKIITKRINDKEFDEDMFIYIMCHIYSYLYRDQNTVRFYAARLIENASLVAFSLYLYLLGENKLESLDEIKRYVCSNAKENIFNGLKGKERKGKFSNL